MSLHRIFNWIIGVPVALVVVAFAIANRQWVTVSFDPLSRDQPFAAVSMPLWALFFCGAFVGLIAGWIAAWLAQGKWRKATREARLELVRAKDEMARLKRDMPGREVVPSGDATL